MARNKGINRSDPIKPTVWIVDDNEDFCRDLEYFLEDYPTRSIHELKSVERSLKTELPEILLLDIMFKRELHAGVEFLRALNSDYPSILVIVVSASRETRDFFATGKFGAFDFIEKGEKDQDFYSELRKKVDAATRVCTVNHILSTILKTPDLIGKLTGRPAEKMDPTVCKVLNSFLAHMSECGPSLSAMSRITEIPASTIHDHFISAFGTPPKATLTEVALVVAGCLRVRGYKIREVAELVGMEPERLRQRFQDEYGCPPSRAHEIPLFQEILDAR